MDELDKKLKAAKARENMRKESGRLLSEYKQEWRTVTDSLEATMPGEFPYSIEALLNMEPSDRRALVPSDAINDQITELKEIYDEWELTRTERQKRERRTSNRDWIQWSHAQRERNARLYAEFPQREKDDLLKQPLPSTVYLARFGRRAATDDLFALIYSAGFDELDAWLLWVDLITPKGKGRGPSDVEDRRQRFLDACGADLIKRVWLPATIKPSARNVSDMLAAMYGIELNHLTVKKYILRK